MIRKEPDASRFKHVQPIAEIRGIDLADVARRVGFAPEISEDFFPGAETCAGFACRLDEDIMFSLLAGGEPPSRGRLKIYADGAEYLGLVLHALDIDPSRVSWRCDDTGEGVRSYELVRQDDNGNTFVLDVFESEGTARRAVRLWERRIADHRQICFVRKRSNTG